MLSAPPSVQAQLNATAAMIRRWTMERVDEVLHAAKDPWVFAIGGAPGLTLIDGIYGAFLLPYSGRITGVYLCSANDIDGDVTVDIETVPVTGGAWTSLIGGGTLPFLSGNQFYDSDDLSDWDTTTLDGDGTPLWVRFVLADVVDLENLAIGLRAKSLERTR